MTVLLLIAGLILLIVGAELLVKGASRLASVIGISPLIIGLTVVAFGTSSPEMAVSVMSGLAGEADVALGNVVGSNIFNVLFILGISALIIPLRVSLQLIRLDVPLMIAVSILIFILAWDGLIGRLDGGLLFLGIVAYTLFLIYQNQKENQSLQNLSDEQSQEVKQEKRHTATQWIIDIGFIILGLALLVLGSQWLVDSAIAIAKYLNVNELIIGLTIIAAGTSLPEVATSVIASIRGERDIAVGNVVGSNIFNILAVLGISSMVSPNGIEVVKSVLVFDIPIMIAVAIACLPVFFTGNIISRWEGAFFLGYYIAYTSYLVLVAMQHQSAEMFQVAMVFFVIPLTVVTLIIFTVRTFTRKV